MNWDQFEKSIGWRYELEPPICRLDVNGNELPEENDEWILQGISAGHVASLQNVRTQHIAELGKDHIYDFRSNPARSKSGIKCGFLVLKVQVFMQEATLFLRPNSRPGEPANRRTRVQPSWTPYIKVISSQGIPPEVTRRATIQYRLWCDDPAIPLMIRFAAKQDGSYSQELSGPSGVGDQLIVESQTYYVSLSHPRVSYEVGVSGFKLDR